MQLCSVHRTWFVNFWEQKCSSKHKLPQVNAFARITSVHVWKTLWKSQQNFCALVMLAKPYSTNNPRMCPNWQCITQLPLSYQKQIVRVSQRSQIPSKCKSMYQNSSWSNEAIGKFRAILCPCCVRISTYSNVPNTQNSFQFQYYIIDLLTSADQFHCMTCGCMPFL